LNEWYFIAEQDYLEDNRLRGIVLGLENTVYHLNQRIKKLEAKLEQKQSEVYQDCNKNQIEFKSVDEEKKKYYETTIQLSRFSKR